MKSSKKIKRELEMYRLKYDLYEKVLCTPKENEKYKDLLKQGKKLPEDIYRAYSDWRNVNDDGDSEFFRLVCPDITQDDIMEYLMYKKLDLLKTIRNCVVFFTILMIIGLVLFGLNAALG
ncbi:MAG: hypothetical protein IJD70_04065 [Clostridia bacterium]|nr:hypothetical protein [Clostridia bacterium]